MEKAFELRDTYLPSRLTFIRDPYDGQLMAVDVDGGPSYARVSPPRRIQLSRKKGWRKPENTVVVARPSKWGNPWRVGIDAKVETPFFSEPMKDAEVYVRQIEMTPALAVELYRQTVDDDLARVELAGKHLACWCPLDQPCHADVLLELANGGAG